MKAFILRHYLKVINNVLDRLKIHQSRLSQEKEELRDYYSLAPIDSAEDSEVYLDALAWALKQGKKVRNIALTGPYGSGKSSIILSFEKKYEHIKEWNFLNISLATFKEESRSDNEKDDSTKEKRDSLGKQETLRLIELSILQQIFYHVDDGKIPDSRFSKIKKVNRKILFVIAVLSFFTTTSLMYLLKPVFLEKFSLFEISGKLQSFIYVLAVLLVGTAFIYIMYHLIQLINGLMLKKVTVNNAEFEVGNKANKSILNEHIDEILYFFEVTNYNIIVIEDLDRFEQTEVFTKLREINLLLNNSDKIKRNIVFLYAVRDEMFETKERAKFFDFIVPVVPVINFSNSKEKLLEIKKENNYDFNDEIINNLALFIDDMRLLYNVSNEYFLYAKRKENEKISKEKLLAIIVYKNVFPSDFSKLYRSEGVLYSVISKKEEYVRIRVSRLKSLISIEKDKLSKAEREMIQSPIDLKSIYLHKIVEQVLKINPSHSFRDFFMNGRYVSLEDALKDENFDLIKSNLKTITYRYATNHNNKYRINWEFEDIEKMVSEESNFSDRIEKINILTENRLREIKQKIKNLENEIHGINKLKLSDLVKEDLTKFDELECSGVKKELLKSLVIQSYIGEDYLDYISIFYEGSLSRSDHDFIVSMKLTRSVGYEHILNNIENILVQLPPYHLEQKYALNFQLLDFFLLNNTYEEHRKSILKLLASEKDEVIKFVIAYMKRSLNIEKFINLICSKWPRFWNVLRESALLTNEEKTEILENILKYADVNSLNEVIKGYLNEVEELSRDSFPSEKDRLLIVLNTLCPKLKKLSTSYDEDVLNHIKENRFYEINTLNLKFLVSYEDENEFYSKNLTCVRKTGDDDIYDYLTDELEEYCNSVFLTIDRNISNDEEDILTILNNDGTSLDTKRKVLDKNNDLLGRVSEVDSDQVYNLCFRQIKVTPTWENVIDSYVRNENTFSFEIIKYLSSSDITSKLRDFKIDRQYPDEESGQAFEIALLKEDSIPVENYTDLISSVKGKYTNLYFEGISLKKVRALIEKKKISGNSENYNYILEHYEEMLIKFVETNQDVLVDEFEKIDYNEESIIKILNSRNISDTNKEKIVSAYGYELYSSSSKINELLLRIISKKRKSTLSEDTKKLIINFSGGSTENKLKAFINSEEIFEKEDVTIFLESLPEPYHSISINGKRPSLISNDLHRDFLEILKISKKYISNYNKTFIPGKFQVITFTKDR